eukprot:g11103.t1
MATATWECGLCLAEGPPSTFERYFEGSGAGDICGLGASGHVFCPDCARDCKEIAKNGRHPDSLAKCPTCRQTVAKSRPDHECLVCRNEGGPQEGRPPCSEAADDDPDAVRVGCWGCGRTAVDPGAMTIDKMERGELMAWNEVPAAMKNNANVIRKAIEKVPLGFRFTQADFAGLSPENRENEYAVVDAIRFGVLTNWSDHVPSVFRGQWKVVVAAMGAPTLRFTINDWRRLDDGLQKETVLVVKAIREGVLTDFWRDVPEELRKESLIANAAVRAGILDPGAMTIDKMERGELMAWNEVPAAMKNNANVIRKAIEKVPLGFRFTQADFAGLSPENRENEYAVVDAIRFGVLTNWNDHVPSVFRGQWKVVLAAMVAPTLRFTINDWRRLDDGLQKEKVLVVKAIQAGVLTDFWRDVPEELREESLTAGAAVRAGLLNN